MCSISSDVPIEHVVFENLCVLVLVQASYPKARYFLKNPWYLLTGQKTVDAHGFGLLVKDRISSRAFGHAVLCENSRRQDSFLAAGEGNGACCSEARWLIAGACA